MVCQQNCTNDLKFLLRIFEVCLSFYGVTIHRRTLKGGVKSGARISSDNMRPPHSASPMISVFVIDLIFAISLERASSRSNRWL